jgi:hypothetical protein
VASAQLLPGNYTIDPAGPAAPPNFQTWAAASAALALGVTGPGNLNFQVASVTFNEAVAFATIAGTSAATQINFVAVGAPAVIDCTGLPIPSDGLTLNGNQSYLNFENIEIRGFSRYGLNLNGTLSPAPAVFSTFCTFRKITVDGPATTSTAVMALRVYHARDCTFEDCTIKGGGFVQRTEGVSRTNYRRCRFDGKNLAAKLCYPFNSNDGDCLWENCFFYDCGPTASPLDINVSGYGNMFWHNTVIVNTTGRAVIMGGCCAWSRSNSFRNNVVVNTGTNGVAIMYGTVSATPPQVLDFNDLDNNIYYAPNGFACELQSSVAPNFTRGTLAQWLLHFNANPGLIPAGGGTSWDQNSFEGDPGLVSATAPYDIRLLGPSTCVNTGTTTYIAGPWISYPAAYVPADDIEKDLRPATGVDIGADEAVVKLLGAGPGQPGTTVNFTLVATTDPARTYYMASSLGSGPIPIDTRFIPLTADIVFLVSLNGVLPTIFSNYANVLNAIGENTAALNLPAIGALVGTTIHTAFVTIDGAAPSGIKSISTPYIFTVAP